MLEAIDGLKTGNLSIEQFIQIAKGLLQIIIDSIRAEQDDSLSKTIRDSARFSADIIKTAQGLNPAEFASTVKAPLQKCYLECLEFLIFRALPVIMSDELQQRVDLI